jgi:hypothetical protein
VRGSNPECNNISQKEVSCRVRDPGTLFAVTIGFGALP